MKNNSLTFILAIVFSLSLIGTANAQVKAMPELSTIINDDRAEEILVSSKSCEVTGTFSIFIALPNTGTTDIPATHTLSADYPPMYIQGTLGTSEVVVQLSNTFDFEGIANLSSFLIYKTTYQISHNVLDLCQSIGKDEFADLQWDATLLTSYDGGTSFETYPICDYTAEDAIFSCSAFVETMYSCPGDVCDPVELAYRSGEVNVNCGKCINRVVPERTITRSGETEKIPSTNIILSPNPSSGPIDINLGSTLGPVQLTLLDISGKKIWQEAFSNEQQNGQLTIHPKNLTTGLYFLKVATTTQTTLIKLVKQ